jgi:hypothetical protein
VARSSLGIDLPGLVATFEEKAGLAPAFLFSGGKISREIRYFPDFVNRVTRY